MQLMISSGCSSKNEYTNSGSLFIKSNSARRFFTPEKSSSHNGSSEFSKRDLNRISLFSIKVLASFFKVISFIKAMLDVVFLSDSHSGETLTLTQIILPDLVIYRFSSVYSLITPLLSFSKFSILVDTSSGWVKNAKFFSIISPSV